MPTVRAAFLLAVFITVTLILLPVQWVALKLNLPLRTRLPHAYHRFVCRLLGMRVTVIGRPVGGGVLMAANHNGWLDITILSSVMPLSFVAKQEVGTWPFFGTLARLQRTIFIRRERSKALEDRNTLRERLLQGEALVIFPEGTSSDGNRVLPFKSALLSAAELAMGEDGGHHPHYVPVQPVSIAYVGLHGMPMGREMRPFFAWYGDMDLAPHFWEAFRAGPIDVVVELHPPLSIDKVGGRKELALEAEKAVRAGLVMALSGAGVHGGGKKAEFVGGLREESFDTEGEGEKAA